MVASFQRNFVIRYTLRQLMEGSVLTQTIISAGILPYLLLIPAVLVFQVVR